MLGNRYSSQVCSVAGALEVVGERWSLLIVREVMFGVRRFDEIQQDLGIARNVLQTRLERLIEAGVLERRLYQQHPPRHEHYLTEKGLDLWPTIASLMQWGDRHLPSPAGPPTVIEHRGCGGTIDEHRICTSCGERLSVRTARAVPGPGAPPNHPLLRGRAAPQGQALPGG